MLHNDNIRRDLAIVNTKKKSGGEGQRWFKYNGHAIRAVYVPV